MSDIEYALNAAANIKGAFAVALVDYDSGMTLGSRGGSEAFDLDVAAPGNSEVVRAKLEVVEKLGLRETIEGIDDPSSASPGAPAEPSYFPNPIRR